MNLTYLSRHASKNVARANKSIKKNNNDKVQTLTACICERTVSP